MRRTRRPVDGVDVLLLDLDGVVYRGQDAIPHAAEVLTGLSGRMRLGFVTNNASRRPETVAEQIRGFGVPADPDDVITSPQAAVRLLAERLPAGSRVLVIGGDGLTTVVEEAGFQVVRSADDDPAAVVQGFAPELGWRDLAEASFALAVPDRLWVATNTDWTIPVARGIAPGNGTLVSAVHSAVGRLPVIAGKPERPLFDVARDRTGARSPLFVGDRLDTDVRGARSAGMASALVLTGVDGVLQLLAAGEESRPDFVLGDLRDLEAPYPEPRRRGGAVTVGAAVARVDGRRLVVERTGTEAETARAASTAVWESGAGAYALEVPDVLRAPRGPRR